MFNAIPTKDFLIPDLILVGGKFLSPGGECCGGIFTWDNFTTDLASVDEEIRFLFLFLFASKLILFF